MNESKVIKAAELIKKWCTNCNGCNDCPFYDEDCTIGMPAFWHMINRKKESN